MFKKGVHFEIIKLAHICINNLTRIKISLTKNLGLAHKFSSSFIVAAGCLYKIENIETRYLRPFHTLAAEDKNILFTFFFQTSPLWW